MSDYFSAPRERPTKAGMYCRVDDLRAVEILTGLTLRPLPGTNVMLSVARYEPYAEAPRHAHAEEQIFFMLDGELEMDLDGDVRTMRPGDIALIPSWVPTASARAQSAPASSTSSLRHGRHCSTGCLTYPRRLSCSRGVVTGGTLCHG